MKRSFSFFVCLILFPALFFAPPALRFSQAKLKPLSLADRARQKVNEYHAKQKEQIDQILPNVSSFLSGQPIPQGEAIPPEAGAMPSGQASPPSPPLPDQGSLEAPAAEGKAQEDETEDSSLRSVDYTSPTQVFYKRECPPEEKDCVRGAVLTNIKSVIFDYSKTRGSFTMDPP